MTSPFPWPHSLLRRLPPPLGVLAPLRWWAIVCPLVLLPGRGLGAQPRQPTSFAPSSSPSSAAAVAVASLTPDRPAVDTMPVQTDSARLATITTDTGAFAPGHRDFTRYNTIGLCLAAARHTLPILQRSWATTVRRDTLLNDTTGNGGTAAVARACGAHFTLANTAEQDHYALFGLALYELNDSLAQSVVADAVKEAPTESAKSDRRIDAVAEFIKHGRLAAAQRLIALADAQGPSPRDETLTMHDLMRRFYQEVSDTVRWRQEIQRVFTLGQNHATMPSAYAAVKSAYADLVGLAVIEHPDELQEIARQAKQHLSVWTLSQIQKLDPLDPHDWRILNGQAVIDALAPSWYSYRRNHERATAPRLQADYWFPAAGHAGSDTVIPVRGKVNLICHQGERWGADGGQTGGWWFAKNIRRWLSMYGAAGLVVTVVAETKGEDSTHTSVKDPGLAQQSRDEDAKMWNWYTHRYQQLPVTLAVQVVHNQWRPLPDGRILSWGETEFYTDYTNEYERKTRFDGSRYDVRGYDGSCAIVGRDGDFVYKGAGNDDSFTGVFLHENTGGNTNAFDMVLRWLFTGPGASVSSPSMSPTGVSPSAVSPPAQRSTQGTL